jgi:hypothetical protein
MMRTLAVTTFPARSDASVMGDFSRWFRGSGEGESRTAEAYSGIRPYSGIASSRALSSVVSQEAVSKGISLNQILRLIGIQIPRLCKKGLEKYPFCECYPTFQGTADDERTPQEDRRVDGYYPRDDAVGFASSCSGLATAMPMSSTIIVHLCSVKRKGGKYEA